MPEKNITEAILVFVDFFKSRELEQDLTEFHSLATALGVKIAATLTMKKDHPDPKYFIGRGKLVELEQLITLFNPELIIFNQALTPAQERNLNQELKCAILDRTQLILNIFNKRARSFEGKLQVELASLEHLATRLVRGWTHLERQRGGIGVRGGPGETQLELDRRVLRQKIAALKKRLESLEQQRSQNRRSRKRSKTPVIALVGYTNAGKSSLFNRLTRKDAQVANMLFTTLDPLLRRVYLPGFGVIVLADTVGFIRNLPHELIKAFHATLEETKEADLLLHVIDATDPTKNTKIAVVNEVLTKIGADSVPQIEVFNKIDLIKDFEPRIDYNRDNEPTRVWLSADKSLGLDQLFYATSTKIQIIQ